MTRKLLHACLAVGIVIVFGCSPTHMGREPDEMYTRAAALKKLSAAVESAVQYKDAPPELADDALLRFAVAHNPSLLDGFEGYVLKARNSNAHAVVLLCDGTGKYALIEDAGCTGEVDVQHWSRAASSPCDFTLDVVTLCDGGDL